MTHAPWTSPACAARLMHATDAKEPASADDFLPVLIYVILKTNPTNFKANLL